MITDYESTSEQLTVICKSMIRQQPHMTIPNSQMQRFRYDIALSGNSGNVCSMQISFGYVAMAVVLPALWGALSVPLVDFVVTVTRGRRR